MGSVEYAQIVQLTVAVMPTLIISSHDSYRPIYTVNKVYACTNTHIRTHKTLTDFMSLPTENNLPIIFKNWLISLECLSFLSLLITVTSLGGQ